MPETKKENDLMANLNREQSPSSLKKFDKPTLLVCKETCYTGGILYKPGNELVSMVEVPHFIVKPVEAKKK
jgi:hypothetical protein